MARSLHKGKVSRITEDDRYSQYFKIINSVATQSIRGVDDVLIEFNQVGKRTMLFSGPFLPEGELTKPQRLANHTGYIPCTNPVCWHEGFGFDSEITTMISTGATIQQGTKGCKGSEASNQGKRPGLQCLNRLEYRLAIVYAA
jgi:hypothetical protein